MLREKKKLIEKVVHLEDFDANIEEIEAIDKRLPKNVIELHEEANLLNEQFKKKKNDGEKLKDAAYELNDLENELKNTPHTNVTILANIIDNLDLVDQKYGENLEDNLKLLQSSIINTSRMLRSIVESRLSGAERWVHDIALVGEEGLQLTASRLKVCRCYLLKIFLLIRYFFICSVPKESLKFSFYHHAVLAKFF